MSTAALWRQGTADRGGYAETSVFGDGLFGSMSSSDGIIDEEVDVKLQEYLKRGPQSMKSSAKFRRMKSYLSRVMSQNARFQHRLELEDWRDCQALIACGFRVMGKSTQGMFFEGPAMNLIRYDAKRSL